MQKILSLLGVEDIEKKVQDILQLEQDLANVSVAYLINVLCDLL